MTTATSIAKELKKKLEVEVPKSSSIANSLVQYWIAITTLLSIPVLLVTIIFVFITAIIIGITMLAIVGPILGVVAFIRRKRGKK